MTMAFHTMEDVLKKILIWEEKLIDFYRSLKPRLKNERTRKIVDALKQRQEKTINIVKQIKPQDYKLTEFMKYLPSDMKGDVLPRLDQVENITPEELFSDILEYEEKMEEYFNRLKNIAVYPKSKDLVAMLIQFKLEQIKEIKALMDDYELAV
jgi:hypothetical protein